MKRILTAAALVALSFASHAELVSTDWKTAGDELATLDTETGIEWMDLSETDGLSINTVLSMTSAGGKFEGWRLPTEDEVLTLFESNPQIGGDGVSPSALLTVTLVSSPPG